MQAGVQRAGVTFEADPGRRARPAPVGIQSEALAGGRRREVPGLEHIRQVLAFQPALVPGTAALPGSFPASRSADLQALQIEVQLVEGHAPGIGSRLERPGTQRRISQHHLVNAHVQRRHPARVDPLQRIGFGIGLGFVLRWLGQAHLLEMDGDGHILGVGQNDVPLHQRAIQAQLPAAGGTLQAGLEIVQVHAETLELANLQVGATQQASLFGTFPGHVLFDQLHPGCGIQFVDAAAHAQALGARQRRRATSKHQFATAFVQLAHGRRQGQAGEPGIVQPVAPLVAVQGHAPAGVAGIGLRLAEWRRQVDRQPFEAGVDAQLAVLALQGQVQVVGQHARSRQGLADAEPGREVLQGDATIGENARTSLAVAALGPGLGAHFAAEGLAADVLRAEASGGVVAESTLEPGKGQLRAGDLQLGVGRAQVHHDVGRVPLLQGDVKFKAAVQRALALPAGEDGAGTDRRLLENLQPVGEVAGQLGVQQQVRYLAGLHMGHLGFGVAHSGVEDPAGRHLDPHAGVLDEHIATGLAQFRPTRLERQPGVMHLEEQAEGAGLRGGLLGEGALVLEEALVHHAALDRFLQPLGQGRVEPW
ncbi:hypothetical protein D3C85_660230 [compost metagenome]